MSTTSPTTGLEPRRTEAVSGLFDALLDFSRSVRARGSDWATLTDDLSRGDLVTLGVVGVHGAIRPGHIAAKLGVDPSDTVAVGDQRNDLEMLSWAARGVAMGNAPDEVKAEPAVVEAYLGAEDEEAPRA